MMASESVVLGTIRASAPERARIVFVSGNFNILHTGHLRLLNFAADCGDLLVVGVNPDGSPGTHMPAVLRLEALSAIGCVQHAVVLESDPAAFVAKLRPSIVVKGKEHESRDNPEAAVLAGYGGRLLFNSGELAFSSIELLRREFNHVVHSTIIKPSDYPRRHGFGPDQLAETVARFRDLRVLVLGDLIVDEYVACDAIGMSQEDPTIVVSPILRESFVGGAGIVAGHAAGLGAKATLCTLTGADEAAGVAAAKLKGFGVEALFQVDETRPTTVKRRYRAAGKTLLRVNSFKHHALDAVLQHRFLADIRERLPETDLLVFSDFSYGCLPQPLVEGVMAMTSERGIPMVADSQSSSQVGDIARFRGMLLVTPTEREARLALRDFDAGLVVVAQTLAERAKAQNVIVTLGAEGVMIHARHAGKAGLITDRLPAFNTSPLDVAGAGDSLLVSTAMALAVGADIWQGAYLGSVAAAGQVGRVGNTPLTATEVLDEIRA